jgi:hypothetical protein
MDLARTFMHDRPDFTITNKKLADHLGVPPGTILSSRDIRAHKEKLITAMTALQKKATRMNVNKKMTLDETALVDIISRLSAMDQSPKSTLFRVVPPKAIHPCGIRHRSSTRIQYRYYFHPLPCLCMPIDPPTHQRSPNRLISKWLHMSPPHPL